MTTSAPARLRDVVSEPAATGPAGLLALSRFDRRVPLLATESGPRRVGSARAATQPLGRRPAARELGLANSATELLPAGTVVLSRTASVGFSGIMPVAMATSQDFWNWIPDERLTAEYLMWTFRAMRSEIQSLMIGSTRKTIYRPTAAAFRVPVPPVDEQQHYGASGRPDQEGRHSYH